MSISMQKNGRFTTEFAAFTKLTLVNNFKNQHDGVSVTNQQSMDYTAFSEALKKNIPIAPENARELPQSEQRDSDLNVRLGGNPSYQQERLNIIKQAYRLGMVDEHGVLISLPQADSQTQRHTVIQAYENSF